MLAATALATVAAAGGGGPGPDERRATVLFNRALGGVVAADRGCLPRPLKSFTDDPPSAALLSSFTLLRRPAGPQDAVDPEMLGPFAGQGIHRGHIRVARSSGGQRLVVFATRDSRVFASPPERCLAARRTRAVRIARRERPRVRRALGRLLDRYERDERARASAPPVEGLSMYALGPGGRPAGGAGGFSLDAVRAHGLVVTEGGDRFRLSALIPDGVATVTTTIPRVVGSPPAQVRLRRKVVRTVAVRDNVIAFSVALPPRREGLGNPGATFAGTGRLRMVWRAADGSVVRTIGPRP